MKNVNNANIRSWAASLYTAYGDSAGWKNYQGFAMPQFGDLPDNIQAHWLAVAKYAIEVINL